MPGDTDNDLCCTEVVVIVQWIPANDLCNPSLQRSQKRLIIMNTSEIHVFLEYECDLIKSSLFWLLWTLSLTGCWGCFAILSFSAHTAHRWASHYADCAVKKLHAVCFIIRLQAFSKLIFLTGSSHSESRSAVDRQLSECNMGPCSRAGAPTVGAPAIEPSWLYWIKHPVMYEAGAAPEGAELPHLLPPPMTCWANCAHISSVAAPHLNK